MVRVRSSRLECHRDKSSLKHVCHEIIVKRLALFFTQQLIYRVKTETKQSIMLTLYPQHDNPPAYLILTPIEPYFYIATLGDYGYTLFFMGAR